LTIIHHLLEHGLHLRLYDPAAMDTAKKVIRPSPCITWCDDAYSAIHSSHAIALITEWKEFTTIRWEKARQTMLGNAFFDGRNLFQPEHMARHGFEYISVGRPSLMHIQDPLTIQTVGT
jgi:UDPglucose 6-dehydrogenase